MRIKNSVVVITGSVSGIGRATARHLARKKACLVLASRRGEALDTLVAECTALGARAIAVPTDVTDADAAHSAGNLYAPSPDPDNSTGTGGWGGKRRTAQRVLAGSAILGLGGAALLPSGRRTVDELWCSVRSSAAGTGA